MRYLVAISLITALTATALIADEQTRLYAVKVGEKWGFMDSAGETEGMAAVYIDPERFKPNAEYYAGPTGKWGYIDATGKLVIPATFAAAGSFSNGLAPVYIGGRCRRCTGLDGGKWGYIDRQGKTVIEGRFDSAQPFSEGLACVGFVRNGPTHVQRWHGYINTAGEFVIEPREYFSAYSFHEGLAVIRGTDPELPLSKQDFGFIDKQGQVAIPSRFSSVGSFSEGLALAKSRHAYGYGYINKAGEWVILPQFSSAQAFVGGLAEVGNRGDGHGYIDRQGRRVAWW